MKNNVIKTSIVFLFFGSLVFAGCGELTSHKTDNTETGQTTKTGYTCPMHPEIKSDKAGQCSKCGMDLVLSDEKENEEKADTTKK